MPHAIFEAPLSRNSPFTVYLKFDYKQVLSIVPATLTGAQVENEEALCQDLPLGL